MRYDDQLAEERDSLALDLAAAYSRPRPSPATRAAIAASLRSAQEKPERNRARVRIPLIAAALVVALGGLTSGANALKNYGTIPQPDPLPMLDLGQQVDVSSSQHGYTLTVNRTYVDANRVVLGFTLRQARNQSLLGAAYPSVTTRDGQVLPRIAGAQALTVHGLRGYAVYDASGMGTIPGSLPIRVRTSMLQVLLTPDAPSTSMVSDPITARVSIPVNQRRLEVDAGQLSISGGTHLTLRRAVLTPTEVRVALIGARGVTGHDLRASLSTCGAPVTVWGTIAAGSPPTVPGHLLSSGDASGAYRFTFPVSLGRENSNACMLVVRGPGGRAWTYSFEAW